MYLGVRASKPALARDRPRAMTRIQLTARHHSIRPGKRLLALVGLCGILAGAAGCGDSDNDDNSFVAETLPATDSSLPDATVGSIYSTAVSVQAPSPSPHTFSPTGGFPPGISLVVNDGDTFSLAGTPTSDGVFDLSVQIVDSLGVITSVRYRLNVVPSGAALTIDPVGLPNASLNQSFSATLTESAGGTAPYSWSLSSGSLPPGMSLDTTSVTNATTLSGTPSAAGSYNFEVRVNDSTSTTRTGSRSYTLVVQ